MTYNELISFIQQNVFDNGRKLIYAKNVRQPLIELAKYSRDNTNLNQAVAYRGIAELNTVPKEDRDGFYLATKPGDYDNFLDENGNPLSLSSGQIGVFSYSEEDGFWSKSEIDFDIDVDRLIQKNTIDELRNLNQLEIDLLKNNIVHHVQLNGYYEKNDLPSPVDYFISDTEDGDNGGSIIEVDDIKLEHDFQGILDVKYFGCFTSVSNATENFQNAVDYINQYKSNNTGKGFPEIIIPSDVSVKTNGGHVIAPGINVTMHGPLLDLDPGNSKEGVVLTIGEEGVSNESVNLKLHTERSTYPSSVAIIKDSNRTGVKLINIRSSFIDIHRIKHYGIGIHYYSDASIGYNQTRINQIINNAIGMKLEADGGWFNENLFIGGTFNMHTNFYFSYPDIQDAQLGIMRHIYMVRTEGEFSTNTFIKPCFEKIGSDDARRCPVYMDGAIRQTKFLDFRYENGTGEGARAPFVMEENGAQDNYYLASKIVRPNHPLKGVQIGLWEDRNKTKYSFFENNQDVFFKPSMRSAQMYLNFRDQIGIDGSNKSTNSPYFFLKTRTGSKNQTVTGAISYYDSERIDIGSYQCGFTLDTQNTKRFIVSPIYARMGFKCYLADGSEYTGSDYFKGSMWIFYQSDVESHDITWNSTQNCYIYQGPQSHNNDCHIVLSEQIKKIDILGVNYNEGITSIDVWTVNGEPLRLLKF